MAYLLGALICFLAWSYFGLILGMQWIAADSPDEWLQADSSQASQKELERMGRMSGLYVSIIGGPLVWCVTIALFIGKTLDKLNEVRT